MSKVFMKLSGICKSFGGVQALKDIDMEIMEGETRCLAGENGGGKSTPDQDHLGLLYAR